MEKIEQLSELKQEIWAVITHNRVLASSLTYEAASSHVKGLGDEYANDATIVINDVAFRQQQKKV